MRQIMVLEKSDIQSLKSGETLTIRLSNGQTMDFTLEDRKAKKQVEESNGNKKPFGWKTKEILRILQKSQEPITARDITSQIPDSTLGGITTILKRLAKRHKEIKVSSSKNKNGTVSKTYQYKGE